VNSPEAAERPLLSMEEPTFSAESQQDAERRDIQRLWS
jgi:hypothetical protein